ncbi:MAG: hypothetical protein HQL64_05645 [Magnetococcales bacterium]|nr:hypothetical protein [Magnetococcales bacterium]
MGSWIRRIAAIVAPYGVGLLLGMALTLVLFRYLTDPEGNTLSSAWEWPPAGMGNFSFHTPQTDSFHLGSSLYADLLPVPASAMDPPHAPLDHTPASSATPRKIKETTEPQTPSRSTSRPSHQLLAPKTSAIGQAVTPPAQESIQDDDTPLPTITIPKCGRPPLRTDPATTDRFFACKWRAGCLERLLQTRQMIQQGKDNCTRSGNSHACRSYYVSLASQYQIGMCDKPP